MKIRNFKKSAQAGFTLIELVVVIVILGILAAVALPNLTSTSTSAYEAKQDATLGALKSAWAVAYAANKAAPTPLQLSAQMSDPVCNTSDGTNAIAATSTTIACDKVTRNTGSGFAVFSLGTLGTGNTITSPANITLPDANR